MRCRLCSHLGVLISSISSTIVQHAQFLRATGLAIVGYFYVDFRDPAKQEARGLVASLLIQLCVQADHFCELLYSLYSIHDRGYQQPSDDELVDCSKDMLKDPGQGPVYIVVDALDECPNSHGIPPPRQQVLRIMEELINLGLPHLHICITSRPEFDIREIFEKLEPRSVSLHDEAGQIQDIAQYIKSVVSSDILMRDWPREEKELVISTLSEQGGGMWVIVGVMFHKLLSQAMTLGFDGLFVSWKLCVVVPCRGFNGL